MSSILKKRQPREANEQLRRETFEFVLYRVSALFGRHRVIFEKEQSCAKRDRNNRGIKRMRRTTVTTVAGIVAIYVGAPTKSKKVVEEAFGIGDVAR